MPFFAVCLPALFSLDTAAPIANTKPHYSNLRGSHLYYYRGDGGSWCLSTVFSPESSTCRVWIASASGDVPVGDSPWQYYDGSRWVVRTLNVRPN
eukprot:SAG22_NODE_1125_length_5476_cov_11.823322_3_plen_95_part_00